MSGDPGDLEGKRTRPLLIVAVGLLAAASFWKLGPPPIPGQTTGDPTPPAEASPAPSATPATEAGGFADGSGVGERTSPPSLAGSVAATAAEDGVLDLLVYGDEQAMGAAGGWPEHARRVLQQRLAVAPAPWTGAKVRLETVARPGLTAAHVASDLTARSTVPELVLVAVGWEDGAAGTAPRVEVPTDPERRWWLQDLATLHTHRDIDQERGFYVRGADVPALDPLRHLELLDGLALWGRDAGAAVVYLEQPIHEPRGDRTWFASTAMRPQPWISLVYGLEQHPTPQDLVGDAVPRLSPRGDAIVGRFVGIGLVANVLAPR